MRRKVLWKFPDDTDGIGPSVPSYTPALHWSLSHEGMALSGDIQRREQASLSQMSCFTYMSGVTLVNLLMDLLMAWSSVSWSANGVSNNAFFDLFEVFCGLLVLGKG